jgi:NAD(P)-dependent dehydrogenase (short-subunit alcohol dehydrogenase family)
MALECDVADADAVASAADTVEHELGPIDVWVNNAMVSVFSPVAELTAAEIRRVTDVTYLGCVHGTLAALARMRARGQGTIVQVSSALAHRAIPLQAAYCGAKHAIKGFSESLRCELLHDRSPVHVARVDLPAINTPQFDWVRSRLPGRPRPAGRIYQPEVAAQAILWAADHAPRELHVGATTAVVVAANRIVPGLLDRYLARAAWDGQQEDHPADPDRRDNLLQPLPGDWGARGRFDAEAHETSWQLAVRTAVAGVSRRTTSRRSPR